MLSSNISALSIRKVTTSSKSSKTEFTIRHGMISMISARFYIAPYSCLDINLKSYHKLTGEPFILISRCDNHQSNSSPVSHEAMEWIWSRKTRTFIVIFCKDINITVIEEVTDSQMHCYNSLKRRTNKMCARIRVQIWKKQGLLW